MVENILLIPQSNPTQIKLANTVNDALAGKVIPVETINTRGGVLTGSEYSKNDKIPVEIGHPIQYDEDKKEWYILSSSTTANK